MELAPVTTTPAPSRLAGFASVERLAAGFIRGRFVRGVFLLTSGTVAGQAIVVLSAPLLTRLYQPEDLGVLAVFTAAVALLAVVASLRYEIAIPLPKEDGQAANVALLSLASVCGMTGLTALGVWLIGQPIADRLLGHAGFPFLGLIPLGVLLAGLYNLLSTWLVRQQDYPHLAATSVVQAVSQAGCQVLLGLAGGGPLGLLAGDLLGRTGGSVTLLRRCWRTSREAFSQATPGGALRVARRYWRFPVVSSSAALVNTGANYLPPVLFAALYDLQTAGWLALAQRILAVPAMLMSNAVAKVYFSECARLRCTAPARLPRLFWKTVVAQSAVAAVIVGCLALPAPLVCGFVFGEQWRAAGWCVLLLAPMYAAKLVAYPLGSTLDVLEKQGWHVFREAVRLVLTVAAAVSATVFELPPLAAAGLLSLASCVAYGVGIVVVWHAVRGVAIPHEL